MTAEVKQELEVIVGKFQVTLSCSATMEILAYNHAY